MKVHDVEQGSKTWKWTGGKLLRPNGDEAPVKITITSEPAESKKMIVWILTCLNLGDKIESS